jgi:cell shape-determining protein MreD
VIQAIWRAVALPVAAFALLALESVVWRVSPWDPLTADLTLPLLLWMGLSDVPLVRGAPSAFAIGYLVDLFSAGPQGLHAVVAVVVYLSSRTASLRLFSAGVAFQMLLTFLASLFTSGAILFLRFIFERSIDNVGAVLLPMAVRGVATALLSPLLFRLARWVGPAGARPEGSVA